MLPDSSQVKPAVPDSQFGNFRKSQSISESINIFFCSSGYSVSNTIYFCSDGGFLSRNTESKNPPAVPPKKMVYENEDNTPDHAGIYELPPYEEHPPYNNLVSQEKSIVT